MKKYMVIALVCMAVAAAGPAFAGEKAPARVADLTRAKLAGYGMDPVIVKAVKAENAKGKTLSSIKEMDEKWMATAGIADFMQVLMDNECGKYIKQIQNTMPFVAEIFVMDNQGANVCMTDKTSDYWQGDEAKFKNSFNNGQGGIFIDEVEFDDSTQVYVSQVSIPVISEGSAIGAITFSVDVDKFN
jgi:hypothetical protein